MDILTESMVILVLILANGVFALAEIAVVAARKPRLESAAAEGDRGARAALELKTAPDRFLSTVQVGITLVGVVAGAYGGATLSQKLAVYLAHVPGLERYASTAAFSLVVAAITYLSVVLGELVPKQLALVHSEAMAGALAIPMRGLSAGAAPLIWLLSRSSQAVLRVMRVRPSSEPTVTEEEIRLVLAEGAHAGVLEQGEHTLVERVMRFVDQRVSSLMTPRTQVVWVDVNEPIGENMRVMCDAVHTYFPVCDGDIERVLGVVSVKELWRQLARDKTVPELRACVMAVPNVPQSMPALKLLETFKQSGRHIALVMDEYGGVAGLVTLHDLLEAMVGDMPAAGEKDADAAVRRPDGSWLLDGMLPIGELESVLNIGELPEEAERVNTLAGLVLARFGHLPKVGEATEWGGWRFEVVDLDGLRIDRVLASRVASEPAADGSE